MLYKLMCIMFECIMEISKNIRNEFYKIYCNIKIFKYCFKMVIKYIRIEFLSCIDFSTQLSFTAKVFIILFKNRF